MAGHERRRALSALVTILFSLVILVAPLIAIAVAQGAPSIKIWAPSDYNEESNESPMVISDFSTGNDEADDVNERTYRLMATSQNTPSPALVEFELQLSTVSTITIGTATQRGPDAWEYDWDISGVVDGEYRVRAILYSGTGLTASEVDRDEAVVLIRSGNPATDAAAEAADITYPLNGDQVGFYTNPLSGSTNTVMQVEYSANTTFVEAFYTVSDVGDEPVWKSCAGPADVNLSGEAPAAGISMRCVLEEADQGGLSVTGLAVVANNSPNEDPFFGFGASYDPNLDQAGDAVRVFPYEQDAVQMTIDDAEVRHDGTFTTCSPVQQVTVTDQNGKPIAGLNVDVHARGPSDQLKYRISGTPGFARPTYPDLKTPDKAHSGTESAFACGSPNQTFATTRQGDHNVPGAPDVKHIESSAGQTNNPGRFGIELKSDSVGGTQVTFWADEDDDDQFCDDEPSAAGSVGWTVPAPPAVGETPVLSDCPIPEPPPPGGTPSTTGPSPTDTGSTSECTIEGTEGDDNIVGTQGNDIICAGDGDDSIDARGGDDIIRGEAGDDLIDGDIGDDTIDGGTGNDRVEGGFDNDLLDGFAGVDVLAGGDGDDTLRGGAAVDGLQGAAGNDVMQGGGGDDVGDGQAGRDILRGYNGQDILRGGGGPDNIRGMNSDDQLTGGGGNDKISGGGGRDQCSGGSGRDKLRHCEK